MRLSTIFCAAASASLLIAATVSASAQTHTYQETVLHSFTNTPDGEYPGGGLLMDSKGNLFGTTEGGGTLQGGTVFALEKSGDETVLYNFPAGSTADAQPLGTPVMDAQGSLYGSTWEGGSAQGGTVFKVARNGQETTLHTFTGENGDGLLSKAGGVIDGHGNVYGTTIMGGASGSGGFTGFGTVYKVEPSGKETVLYSFTGQTDGGYPYASLVLDESGNLYGTTYTGGDLSCNTPNGCGTVFKVDPAGNETVLYGFTDAYPDFGLNPTGGLARDAAGNLYGTTVYGGTGSNHGNVFKLSAEGTMTNLYSFTGVNGDGQWPGSNLTLDAEGNLYGATGSGGTGDCDLGCGVIFRVSPSGRENILFSFSGGTGGFIPSAVIRDRRGNLYGTTVGGGTLDFGTVFKLSLD